MTDDRRFEVHKLERAAFVVRDVMTSDYGLTAEEIVELDRAAEFLESTVGALRAQREAMRAGQDPRAARVRVRNRKERRKQARRDRRRRQ